MEAVSLLEGAFLPFALVGDESLGVTLRYTPTTSGEARISLIVAGEAGLWPFEVLGASPGCPQLQVTPDAIDLGCAAVSAPIQRMVTLSNTGSATLHVSSVSVADVQPPGQADRFQLDLGGEPAETLPTFEIAGDGFKTVNLAFTADGQAARVTAVLRIVSDDPSQPTLDVPILVNIEVGAICRIAFVPGLPADLGTTTVGTPIDRVANLVNTGTGHCTFQGAIAHDCPADAEGNPACPAPFTGDPSTAFSLSGTPATRMNGIAPGAVVPLTIRFAPTAAGPDPSVPRLYHGLLAVKVLDELQQKTQVIPVPGDGVYAPNLVAGALPAP